MQLIASENNLSETAFVVPRGNEFEIRWFTPEYEVDLCGHATLASGHVLMQHWGVSESEIVFHSQRSGRLTLRKDDNGYVLNFPVDNARLIEPPADLVDCFEHKATECWIGKSDSMLVFESQEQIESISPDFRKIEKLDTRGVIVTAAGNSCDFVSRFFAPGAGIPEDPVTGSAHTMLTPYWANVLGRKKLTARQLSSRGGKLACEDLGERIEIGGSAVTYLIGEINIQNNH